MFEDPIVDRIRRDSERLAARFDFDLQRLGEGYQACQLSRGAVLLDRCLPEPGVKPRSTNPRTASRPKNRLPPVFFA
jgi:hypothetical protein